MTCQMLMFKLLASTDYSETCTDWYDADAATNSYCIPADGINDFSDIDIDYSHITQIYGNSSGSECSDLDVNLDCM